MAAKHATPMQALSLEDAFDGDIAMNEPMSKHTTYRIGGPARYYVCVNSISALKDVLSACDGESISHVVVGKGSNLLVADKGYPGAVITLGRDFSKLTADSESSIISAGAGVLLKSVVEESLRASLTGMEFAVGTPGTLGGALRMNAGSADDWIGSRVRSVTTYSEELGLVKRMGSDMEWGYRTSSFLPDEAIVECELLLAPGNPFFIQGKMEANHTKRKRTQPLGLPSCGSVFKNPPGKSAAKLIDELGLKGTMIGRAQISEKHANFIVNLGGAKASDVARLIDLVAQKVEEAYGIGLKTEVKTLGFG